jgi:TonB dependent receptor-like, beta-barrel/Carboxypeptidase regulatory-like domain/TonB-dependent Receptor Plug Domain
VRASHRVLIAVAFAAALAAPAAAIVFGSVRGTVEDPQHRAVPGASVTLKAADSAATQSAVTDATGSFVFPAIPVGDYTLTVALQGFTTAKRSLTVVSSSATVLQIELAVAALNQSISVSATPAAVAVKSVTPITLVDRREIQATPGADRTNSLAAITAYVPGAYMVHDQLHVRGGHQVTWLVDGVPVPNTNIASNVGPQFDPKDMDYLEAQRGSYDAQYGDRTYGVFNVVPRTGFERNREAEVVASAGQYSQTNDQMSFGDHTDRTAYFVSGNFNRSDLGLETPVADITHDAEQGYGGFGDVIFNQSPVNQFRFVASARRDRYQIPLGPDDVAAGISDEEHESDVLLNMTWARTLQSHTLLTVSPLFHDNAANYLGGSSDPVTTTDRLRSRYLGAQATINVDAGIHSVQAGFYGFHQWDRQLFGLTFNDGSGTDFSVTELPTGTMAAFFAADTIQATSWLTFDLGIRETHFSGGVTENVASPRLGATVLIPRANVTVRGFWGRFYQAPPLLTASGPLLQLVTSDNLGFIPLNGERDEEYQFGASVPVQGWTVDVDHFHTLAHNFFDHGSVDNSNIFFPLTIDGARIRGTEVTVRSPRIGRTGEFHLAYSYQHADGEGAITGGLTDFSPPDQGYFPLDHDQRNTLSAGFTVTLPHGVPIGANLYYGSGVPDDDTGTYLSGRTTLDLTAGKTLTKDLSASLTALNVTNRHILIDNSETFGGVHFNDPRQIYVELRYTFRY